MNNSILILASFFVGIMVVIQGAINAKLGMLLKHPILATITVLSLGALLTAITAGFTVKEFPTIQNLKEVPLYMWLTGGILSFIAVTLFYYIIPRVGISTTVTFGLAGQVIFAAIAGHFSWFGLPFEPLTVKKILGTILMIISVMMIKS